MKRKQRICFILALIMVLLQVPLNVFAADFPDTKNHWARNYVDWATKQGYIQGYPDGTFKPDNHMTNAEYYRVTNQSEPPPEADPNPNPAPKPDNPNPGPDTPDDRPPMAAKDIVVEKSFTSVKKDDWFYLEYQKGISKGYLTAADAKRVGNPNDKMTREEAVRILAFNQKWSENPGATGKFKDAGEISDICKGYVGAAVENQVINGYPDGTFRPKAPLTRAEVVTVLAKLKKADIQPVSSTWHWTFENDIPYFQKGYSLNESEVQKVYDTFYPKDAQMLLDDIEKSNLDGWGGSCFGFALTVEMYRDQTFKVEKLNTPQTSDISKIVPDQDQNYKPQSVLNFYQMIQSTGVFKNWLVNKTRPWMIVPNSKYQCVNLNTFVKETKAKIDKAKSEGGLAQICIGIGGSGGHALTIHDYEVKGDKFIIKVYDPNLHCKEIVVLPKENRSYGINLGINASMVDGESRSELVYLFTFRAKELMNALKNKTKGGLNFMSVKNSTEVQTMDGKTYTLNKDYKEGAILPGFDKKRTTYVLPDSDYYILPGGETEFSYTSDDSYISVETDNATRTTIKDDVANVEGQKGNYKITIASNDKPKDFKYHSITIEGKDANNLRLAKGEEGFDLQGDNLKGVKIKGNDGGKVNEVTINTDKKKVSIGDDNGQLVTDDGVGVAGGKPDDPYYEKPDANHPLVGSWKGRITVEGMGEQSYKVHIGNQNGNTFTLTGQSDLDDGSRLVFVTTCQYDPKTKMIQVAPTTNIKEATGYFASMNGLEFRGASYHLSGDKLEAADSMTRDLVRY
ncbi:MAG: S-layer homology domain-containing protein [Tissierellia bacterium]|nr:S-layer homology domain-containing protein [Tissierellia bacterium]